LVGDVMRGGVSHDVRRDTAFLLRLQEALVQEAGTRPAPEPVVTLEPAALAVEPLRSFAGRPSANEARFQWRWVAGVAVMAVAVSVGWMAVPGTQQGGVAPMLAQVPGPAPLAGTASAAAMAEAVVLQPAMIRDPKLDQWLAAHRQFGGASALQAPAGFVRNATFEGAAR
jgi:sigma-E factor negative regulatory protein RseA